MSPADYAQLSIWKPNLSWNAIFEKVLLFIWNEMELKH